MKSFTLPNQQQLPAVGLGTWGGLDGSFQPGEVRQAVSHAIKSGYRHIDAAWAYRNEKEVGQGIRDAGVPRSELFITSKLFENHHEPDMVPIALQETLDDLGVDYLDLYLMHWPMCSKPVSRTPGELTPEGVKRADGKFDTIKELSEDHLTTWRALEKLVDDGKIRNIGISNFNIRRTRQLMQQDLKHPIAVNQVEVSLQNPQPELVSWLQKHKIVVEAYSPLGSTGAGLRNDPVITKLAEKHGVDPATILISWPVARGIVVLAKSGKPERIASNLHIVDLTQEETDAIMQRAMEIPRKRVCDQSITYDFNIFEDDHPDHNDAVQSKLD